MQEMYNKEIIKKNSKAIDYSIIKLAYQLIIDAIDQKASDIHFEPHETHLRVRYRIDGLLLLINHIKKEQALRLNTRLKIMANLDISEKRLPQDGRFQLKLPNQNTMNFRISTCPTLFGEKIVIRILYANDNTYAISELGFTADQVKLFLQSLQKSQGLILVTGPTGSGKTLTLYSGLNDLNTEQQNILTVEDPIEIHLPGINQVSINSKTGLDFATALRAFLRQDPDIIMVGEMRDHETAEIGIKAAQTGHLVLSTLHTNNAVESIIRLNNMGIAHYNIASALSLVIAQRLVRLLCKHCKVPDQEAKMLPHMKNRSLGEKTTIFTHNNKGCQHCHQGYRGRTGIFEVIAISDPIRAAILKKSDVSQLQELAAQESMLPLRTVAYEKVLSGITSFSEINRVI